MNYATHVNPGEIITSEHENLQADQLSALTTEHVGMRSEISTMHTELNNEVTTRQREVAAAVVTANNYTDAREAVLSDTDSNLQQQILTLADDVDERLDDLEETVTEDLAEAISDMNDSLDDLRDEITNTVNTRVADLEEASESFGTDLFVADDRLYLRNGQTIVGDGVDFNTGVGFTRVYQDDNGYVHFVDDNDVDLVVSDTPFAGGSGGGSSSATNYKLTASNLTEWISTTVSDSDSVNISLSWSSVDEDSQNTTGAGALKIIVGSTVKATLTVQQGTVSVDVKDYLSVGTNRVRLQIKDSGENSKTFTYTVTVISLQLQSTFDPTAIQSGNLITFPYVAYGAIERVLHIIVDDGDDNTVLLSSSTAGKSRSYDIPKTILATPIHGSHTILAYFETRDQVNGRILRSNELTYHFTYVDSSSESTVITSSFTTTSVQQFETVYINYSVYRNNAETIEVKIYINNELYVTRNDDLTVQLFTYTPDTVGPLSIRFEAGDAVKTFNLTVTASTITATAETDGLKLYLTSAGRSNNDNNYDTWSYTDANSNTTTATFSNFTWTTDGWQTDSNGDSVLRVIGDARVTIPYQIFATNLATEGATIEVEFATHNIENSSAVVLSCMNGGRGIEIHADETYISSEATANKPMNVEYAEDEHVRISFVIEKRSSYDRPLLLGYINGVLSRAAEIEAADNFEQGSPVSISIGSNDCGVDIYNIRVYNKELTRFQILDNWIADTANFRERYLRFSRNQIFSDVQNHTILPSSLPNDLPYLVVECMELPQYKGDPKYNISGYFIDPVNTDRSYCFENATIDVQGTSSSGYYRKNYLLTYSNFIVNKANVDIATFIQNRTGVTQETYEILPGVYPVNVFCMKADVASCESANNTVSATLFDELVPYRTPAYELDNKIRQSICGFPCVMFWVETDKNGEGRRAIADPFFLGKYNFNLDKSTPVSFGFSGDDESWEVLDNNKDLSTYRSADYSNTSEVAEAFECRYPGKSYKNYGQLEEFGTWVNSTYRNAATDEALAESVTIDGVTYTNDTAAYRLAKFKNEISTYCEVDSAVFYYLYTEILLDADGREKNSFPSFIGSAFTGGE